MVYRDSPNKYDIKLSFWVSLRYHFYHVLVNMSHSLATWIGCVWSLETSSEARSVYFGFSNRYVSNFEKHRLDMIGSHCLKMHKVPSASILEPALTLEQDPSYHLPCGPSVQLSPDMSRSMWSRSISHPHVPVHISDCTSAKSTSNAKTWASAQGLAWTQSHPTSLW